MSKAKKLIRAKFNDRVFKRDGYKCVFCGSSSNLDAHHITDRDMMPNGGYVLDNGVTVCPEHHLEVEEQVEGKTPEDLYLLIKSSYEDAYQASLWLDPNHE